MNLGKVVDSCVYPFSFRFLFPLSRQEKEGSQEPPPTLPGTRSAGSEKLKSKCRAHAGEPHMHPA